MSQTVDDDILHTFFATGQPSAIEERCRSGLLIISRGTAILLLLVYVAYLIFQLKTHDFLFKPAEGAEVEVEPLEMSPVTAGSALLIVTLVTSFAADYRE
jgi:Ca2+:H+ antiporter